jgi:hypothetical protein
MLKKHVIGRFSKYFAKVTPGQAASLALAALLLWTFAGCPARKSAPKNDVLDRELWDACYIQGLRVGYMRTAYYRTSEADKPALRIEGVIHLTLMRFGQEIKQEISCATIETPEGQLLSCQSEMTTGSQTMRTTGRVAGEKLELETVSQGKKTGEVIAWKPQYGGFYALEESLARQPMQSGEMRTLQALIIGFNQLGTIELLARDWEDEPLLNGNYELLRIDTVVFFPNGQQMRQIAWSDRTGEILKTRSLPLEMETYRVSKAEALEKNETPQFDIGLSTAVKLDKPLPNPRDTKRVVYRVHLPGGDPAAAFLNSAAQKVTSFDPHTAELTVYAVRPDQPGNVAAPYDPPTKADRQPNNWIQSDNPKIIALAKQAAGEEKDPWLTALKLEQFVHGYIKEKDFSQAFATAAEVADSREGDCTEHAVLLAALCRALGIPARVAIGLVYVDGKQEFGFHMWDEVYIKNKWIPLDATLAKGGIGADHLQIARSSLSGAAAYGSFLPVVQVVGQLKIKVMEAE